VLQINFIWFDSKTLLNNCLTVASSYTLFYTSHVRNWSTGSLIDHSFLWKKRRNNVRDSEGSPKSTRKFSLWNVRVTSEHRRDSEVDIIHTRRRPYSHLYAVSNAPHLLISNFIIALRLPWRHRGTIQSRRAVERRRKTWSPSIGLRAHSVTSCWILFNRLHFLNKFR